MNSLLNKSRVSQMVRSSFALVVLVILVTSIVLPAVSYAQTDTSLYSKPAIKYTLLEPLPCVEGNGSNCKAGTQIQDVDFQSYVQYVFNLVIAFAAVAAVFMIVWGGFMYMTSESIQKKNDGLSTVRSAVTGLLLVLCSYLILRTIDPRLVEIPTTLVDPLKITITKSQSSAFLTEISEQERAQIRADRSDATTKIASLDGDIKQLSDQLTQYEDAQGEDWDKSTDPTYQQLQSSISEKKGEQILTLGVQSIKNLQLKADAAVQTPAQIYNIMKESDAAEKSYEARLAAAGQFEQITELEAQTTVVQAKLGMQQQLSVIVRKGDPSLVGGSLRDVFYYWGYGIAENLSYEQARSKALDNVLQITKMAQSRVGTQALKSEIGKYATTIMAAIDPK